MEISANTSFELQVINVMFHSLRQKLWTNCYFIKQKCHIQGGIAQLKNATTPLGHRHSFLVLVLTKEVCLKGSKISNRQNLNLLSKTYFTFLLWLLLVLMCGVNAFGTQWYCGISILRCSYINMELLLHKTATTVRAPLITALVQ